MAAPAALLPQHLAPNVAALVHYPLRGRDVRSGAPSSTCARPAVRVWTPQQGARHARGQPAGRTQAFTRGIAAAVRRYSTAR